MSNILVVISLAALWWAALCGAHPYTNHAAGYAMELPAGWTATGAEDANPAEFTGPGGVSAKLRVIPRPQPLSDALAGKLEASDGGKVAARFPRSRAFKVVSGGLGTLDTKHYGFVYLNDKTEPRVLRFTLASRAATAGYTWLKVQFAYPRLQHATAQPAIDQFLKAFRFVEAPAIAHQALPPTGSMPPVPLDAASDVAGALVTGNAPMPVAQEPPSGPAGEQMDADSQYYLSLNQKMSEKDTAAHVETFRGGAEHRSEEEMARARSFGMGDILKPNE